MTTAPPLSASSVSSTATPLNRSAQPQHASLLPAALTDTPPAALPILSLKKKGDERIRSGHHWVFSNELQHVPTDLATGSLVEVRDSAGRSHGSALFNPHSLIAARLLKTHATTLDAALITERLRHAERFRSRLFAHDTQNSQGAQNSHSPQTAYRLAFGESDLLPGLIIDRYGEPQADGSVHDYFALQTLAAGMDTRKEAVVEALRAVFPTARAIIEKNNSALRKLEGLELHESVLWSAAQADDGSWSAPDEVQMRENGLTYAVSLLHGQKTGYFLDQKLNRQRVQDLASGLRVLDCFTNQGGFALNAARGGATHVLGLDSSASAIARCRTNARLNHFENLAQFETEEVFDFLAAEARRATDDPAWKPWDCIILDPPAFTKSRKTIPVAKRGYAKINRLALKLLPAGGILATGSCSHHISEDMFLRIIQEQAFLERRELRLIFHGTQSPCHPILVGMPETRYLKFFMFEVL
jgi:23S rRNA (cytosine1962-C5)-methyltransferase